MQKLMISVLLVLVLTIVVRAQTIGPEAPILGKATFGINGMAVAEVALPSEVSYNPAAIPLALAYNKKKGYAEVDAGYFDFTAGPLVKNDWEVAAVRLTKQSAIRLARYGIESDAAETRFLGPGADVSFNGETYELAYGQSFGRLSLGAVWVDEKILTNISSQGVALVNAAAKSDHHWRIGGHYQLTKTLAGGVVFTRDPINASTTFQPALTGEPTPTTLRSQFKEKLLTYGVAWQPRLGTALFYTRQTGKITGPAFRDNINLETFGARQYFNEHLALAANRNGGVWGFEADYFTPSGVTIATSFSHNCLKRNEAYLGRADVTYVWVGRSW